MSFNRSFSMNPLLFVDIFERKILRRKTFASLIRKCHLTVITVQVNTYGNNKINLKRKPARSNGDITHMKYTNENYIFVPDISNDKTISRQDFFQLSQVKKWICFNICTIFHVADFSALCIFLSFHVVPLYY